MKDAHDGHDVVGLDILRDHVVRPHDPCTDEPTEIGSRRSAFGQCFQAAIQRFEFRVMTNGDLRFCIHDKVDDDEIDIGVRRGDENDSRQYFRSAAKRAAFLA